MKELALKKLGYLVPFSSFYASAELKVTPATVWQKWMIGAPGLPRLLSWQSEGHMRNTLNSGAVDGTDASFSFQSKKDRHGARTPVFIAVQFTIAKRRKQLRCPSRDEWISKMWCIHIVEHHSALNRKEILTHATMWRNLEDMMLEISQDRRTNSVRSSICVIPEQPVS